MKFSEPQLLDGKWLLVKNAGMYMIPEIPIFEFGGLRTTLYDFDKEV